jgi:hypothetical protein
VLARRVPTGQAGQAGPMPEGVGVDSVGVEPAQFFGQQVTGVPLAERQGAILLTLPGQGRAAPVLPDQLHALGIFQRHFDRGDAAALSFREPVDLDTEPDAEPPDEQRDSGIV